MDLNQYDSIFSIFILKILLLIIIKLQYFCRLIFNHIEVFH